MTELKKKEEQLKSSTENIKKKLNKIEDSSLIILAIVSTLITFYILCYMIYYIFNIVLYGPIIIAIIGFILTYLANIIPNPTQPKKNGFVLVLKIYHKIYEGIKLLLQNLILMIKTYQMKKDTNNYQCNIVNLGFLCIDVVKHEKEFNDFFEKSFKLLLEYLNWCSWTIKQ